MEILNILTRHHVPFDDFDNAVAFYVSILGREPRLALEPVEGQLKLAQIASMLVIGANEEIMPHIADIRAAYLVSDIDAWATSLEAKGATIEVPISPIPTGSYMVVRHPDGLRVEYVEHARKHPSDRMSA